MKTAVIIQARMSSSRLPGKVLKDLNGKPVLQNIVERVSRAKRIDEVIVATSVDATDDPVERLCTEIGAPVFRGSLENVLERYYNCACSFGADVIIRCTGDNALVDPQIIDDAVACYAEKEVDYLLYRKGLPIGMAVEVFDFPALQVSYYGAKNLECLEHVTPYMKSNPQMFKVAFHEDLTIEDYSYLRFTMDTPEDYQFVRGVYSNFDSNNFTYEDMLALLRLHPEMIKINEKVEQHQVKYKGE